MWQRMKRMGKGTITFQDELGSPLRIEDSARNLRESYGYGVFGEDLYQNQGKIQPFGYTGYQRDETAGTYYARKGNIWQRTAGLQGRM